MTGLERKASMLVVLVALGACESGTDIAGASSNPGGKNPPVTKDGGGSGETTGADTAADADATVGPALSEEPYWKFVQLEDTSTWNDLHGFVRDDGSWVLAVAGPNGTVGLHDATGTDWRTIGVSNSVNSVWAYDDDTVFVAGDGGLVRQFNAVTGAWDELLLYPNLPDFKSVGGSAPDDVYVGGINGALWHWNGADWTEVTDFDNQPLLPSTIDDIWVDATGVAYMVSDKTVLWGKGLEWQTYTPPQPFTLSAVGGVAPGNVFAVGFGPSVLHLQGDAWTTEAPGIVAPVFPDVWGWAADGALALTLNKTQPLVWYHEVQGALAWDRVREEDPYSFVNVGPGEKAIPATSIDLLHIHGFGPDNVFIAVKGTVGGLPATLLQFARHPVE